MARSRPKTRRMSRSNPRGILRVMSGGYGFVQTAEGEYFVPASKMRGAFNGDTVELSAIPAYSSSKSSSALQGKTHKPTARVVRVVHRAYEVLIGRYEVAEPFGVVVPEDPKIPYDIFTLRSENPSLTEGDIVRVRITEYPTRTTAAQGSIEAVLGHEDEESLAIEMIIARHKLETEFSSATLEEAQKIQVEEEVALAEGYRDVRERTIFTVDPEDARDFDDALSLDEVDGLWCLGVHIADVSRYVAWNSSIDLDARRRATSVYLADRVIPMLPEELSTDVCSLKPHETRTALSVDIYLDKHGHLKRYELYPSVICSSARFTYEEVQSFLDGVDTSFDEVYQNRFKQLNQIAQLLIAQRNQAGSIDFATTEAKVRLDEAGVPYDIAIRRKTEATAIIEEAMILANTVVASHLCAQSFPCVYRVHEAPSADDLKELIPIMQEFDYFKEVTPSRFIAGDPFALQHMVEASKGKPEEELISSLLLRAMKRAVYKPCNEGHYGLAKEAYTHFTSPIRRYPDLIVHRMLKAYLRKKSGTFEQQVGSLEWLSEHASKMERIAEAAERESQETKIIEYLERSIGARYTGIISGVTTYGFFVRLANTAEGLVGVNSLGDEYFSYDAKRHVLKGEESGKEYRLGQRVEVVLEYADARLGHLDFLVV